MGRMTAAFALLASGGALVLGVGGWLVGDRSADRVFDPPSRKVEPLPPVPWRDPVADLARFFPGSTATITDTTRILSGARVALEARLRRPVRADENVLLLHRIDGNGSELGTVATRRARGEHGAIDLVLALDRSGALQGIRVQAMREPAEIAQVLTNEAWLGAFRGMTADRRFRVGAELPAVPAVAQKSAEAVAECVHDLLVLFSVPFVSATTPHH